MGWFLKSGKSTSKSTSKRGKSPGPSWDAQRTLMGVKLAGFAGAVVAVALSWHYGTQRLEAAIRVQQAVPISAEDVRFSDSPTQMSAAGLNQLRAEIASLVGDNPLNGKGLRDAAELLRDQPATVRELRQVRRTPAGTIEIDLDFRKPAALVLMRNERNDEAAKDGYHVVDNSGFQMFGPRFMSEVAYLNLPLIEGVNSKFRPKDNLGEHRWQGQEVDAGLALIAVLKKAGLLDLVESVAVNLTDERGRIRLVINTLVVPVRGAEPIPCRIVWGLPPGQERSIEPDIDRKITALTATLSDSRYRVGHWEEVWINTGVPRPVQLPAIQPAESRP